jgi:hypothetical protein
MYTETILRPFVVGVTPGAGSGTTWLDPVASVGALPVSPPDPVGTYRFVTGTGETYFWNGSTWVLAGQSIGAPVIVSATAPTSPVDGMLWSKTDTNITFQYDSTISRWASLETFEIEGFLISATTSSYLYYESGGRTRLMSEEPFVAQEDLWIVEFLGSQSARPSDQNTVDFQVVPPPFGTPAPIVTVSLLATGPNQVRTIPSGVIVSSGGTLGLRCVIPGSPPPGQARIDLYAKATFRRLA